MHLQFSAKFGLVIKVGLSRSMYTVTDKEPWPV